MNRNLRIFFFVWAMWWGAILVDALIQLVLGKNGHIIWYNLTNAWFYSIPVILLTYIILFYFNYLMKIKYLKSDRRKFTRYYWVMSLLFSFPIPAAFTAFDYSQRGRYLRDSDFYNTLKGYLFLFCFSIVLFLLNKIFFWKKKAVVS